MPIFNIPIKSGVAKLDTEKAVLSFFSTSNKEFYNFKLSPCIEYLDKSVNESKVKFLENNNNTIFTFKSEDDFTEKIIKLTVLDGFIDYVVTAIPKTKDVPIKCVHYGQDASGIENASAHLFDEFYIICPDRYGTCIPKKEKVCFKLGVPSFRFDKDNNFPHEAGRAIISPYFTALRVDDNWFGIGTMEIPNSEYGLNMSFLNGKAVTDFYYGGNLKLSGEYNFPRITFFTGTDKLDVGKIYVDRCFNDGLAVVNEDWDESWGGPIYCFFSDQMYEYQTDRDTPAMQGEMTMTDNYCNDAFLDKCLKTLEEKSIGYKIIIIDYGWFITNGEWKPNTKRFADFKATIKKLQAMGKKVLVWYSPYFNAKESTNYRTHPEIGVNKRDGTPFYVVRFGTEINYQSDFTHPSMRELCQKDIEFMLSKEGLDADGIKVDCTHQPPTIDNVFFDPSWGLGEMFHYKASKFMYDEAKKIKPKCCINATAGNPFFNRTYDIHRIHDAMEYNLDAYEERAWAAWFCRLSISDLDDWPSYDIFTVRANLRKIAYGVPSIYAAIRRGGERKPKASWGYSISVTDDEYDLLSSIYDLYILVPVDITQKITIDPFRKIFNRKYTKGKLSGFYAATTISGNQATAVYQENSAHIVSIANSTLCVPLPYSAKNSKPYVVSKSGKETAIEKYEIVDNEMIFEAKRCVKDISYYKINYSL